MATFSEDNFGNDGAMAYLSMLTARLVATIQEVMADDSRLGADEDGETMLMPSVEVLALLCERYACAPPRPDVVEDWRQKYLAAWDQTIGRLRPKAAFKTARRKVIDKTFRWLEGLAQSHWEAEGGA